MKLYFEDVKADDLKLFRKFASQLNNGQVRKLTKSITVDALTTRSTFSDGIPVIKSFNNHDYQEFRISKGTPFVLDPDHIDLYFKRNNGRYDFWILVSLQSEDIHDYRWCDYDISDEYENLDQDEEFIMFMNQFSVVI